MLTKDTAPAVRARRDPFTLMRQMTSALDRMFDDRPWPMLRLPLAASDAAVDMWTPEVDVFERDNRIVTRIDLPGTKKEDVHVDVADGRLAISGERKLETEEKKDHYYHAERHYGSFYRQVPLPEGVKLEDVTATFADGVLEVSVPVPAAPAAKTRSVEIRETPKAAKPAA